MTKEEIIDVISKCFVVDDNQKFNPNTYSFYKDDINKIMFTFIGAN